MKLYTYHGSKSSGIGGIETLYRNIHNLMLDKNWEVTELYFKPVENNFEVDNRINSYKIKQLFFVTKRIGIYIQSLYLALFFLLKKEKKNIVLMNIDIRLLYFFPTKLLSKINVVIIQHSKLEMIYGKVAKSILKDKYKYLNFTVYTKYDKQKLMKMFPFINHNNIHIIPRGCKLKTKSVNNDINNNQFNLVTIGRISKEKNLTEMIKLMDVLPDKYKLYIYGHGKQKEVSKLKLKIKNKPSITYEGPAINIYTALSNKSLFLMTSSYEGYGQTLIEARSQGLPIVAYETFDALQTIVEDGFNGYRIKPLDRNSFINSVLKISEDLNLYQTMSDNAIFKAKETENDKINKKWDNLFTKLIERKS